MVYLEDNQDRDASHLLTYCFNFFKVDTRWTSPWPRGYVGISYEHMSDPDNPQRSKLWLVSRHERHCFCREFYEFELLLEFVTAMPTILTEDWVIANQFKQETYEPIPF